MANALGIHFRFLYLDLHHLVEIFRGELPFIGFVCGPAVHFYFLQQLYFVLPVGLITCRCRELY